jgi:hypothetical protein
MTTKTIQTCEVEDELVPLAAVYAAERKPYIVDGLVVASSRTTPCLAYSCLG